MEALLGLLGLPLLFGLLLAYMWLQARLLRRWRGAWRVAAALSLGGWAAWLASFARDVTRDPTSHNLFPFEILIGACLAAIYLVGLAIAHRLGHVPPR